jgi:hypothetical protein
MLRFSGRRLVGRISTMNEEEQVELLCRVDIFEDLPEEEIRQVLKDLLRRNAEINLGRGRSSTLPESRTASCSYSSRAGCASTRWRAPESSPWRF